MASHPRVHLVLMMSMLATLDPGDVVSQLEYSWYLMMSILATLDPGVVVSQLHLNNF